MNVSLLCIESFSGSLVSVGLLETDPTPMLSKIIKIFLGSLAVLIMVGVTTYFVRYKPMLELFEPAKKAENFRHMADIFPANTIPAPDNSYTIPAKSRDQSFDLVSQGFQKPLETLLEDFSTTGFLVIKDDSILYEKYFTGATDKDLLTSFSLSKSITSILIGIALDEGKIDSIEDPVDKYIPTLTGTGYEGVTIRNILQMASGIKFSEDYGDPDSDINQVMFKTYVYFEHLEEWITEFESERPQGEKHHYQSINTEILAVILKNVYDKPLSELLSEKIWQPMGAEQDANWNTDEYDTEIAFGFLNATLRDYAKIGLLMLHKGELNGHRIVSEAWVEQSTTIRPGESRPVIDKGNGYQFHWWIPTGNDEGEFMASGYMGQVIYVNPARNVVIVKTGTEESKHLPLLQAIARDISPIVQPDSIVQDPAT